ncbi:MAG: adenylate/guanylate cyclase domain-containing protein [Dehalococcoidia bacterium]
MQQQIQFCTTSDGVRIAYATLGEAPPVLVFVRGWVSHLELDWELEGTRAGYEEYGKRLQVVRYDKRGTGLSDRNVDDFSIAARLRDLEAVVDRLELQQFALAGYSEGGPIAIAYAAAHPERISHLVLFGTYARGQALGRVDVKDALVALVTAEWGLGSETLTNMFMPGASKEEHAWFTRYQREAASRSGAAAMLRANYEVDVSNLLPDVNVPTLVMHVKGDRAISFAQGREIASAISDARFLPIEGDRHAPDEATAKIIRDATLQFVLGNETPASPQAVDQQSPLTILFTDIASSTALTQQLGDAGAQELVRSHDAIVREALRTKRGTEIKHTGDGIMASFGSVTAAVECAVAVQQAVTARDDERLAVRIGINAGEPLAEDNDLFGSSVQLARRICDHAGTGEILVADVVRQLVAGKGFLFADRGVAALKGFEDPTQLYELRWREAT